MGVLVFLSANVVEDIQILFPVKFSCISLPCPEEKSKMWKTNDKQTTHGRQTTHLWLRCTKKQIILLLKKKLSTISYACKGSTWQVISILGILNFTQKLDQSDILATLMARMMLFPVNSFNSVHVLGLCHQMRRRYLRTVGTTYREPVNSGQHVLTSEPMMKISKKQNKQRIPF